MSVRNKRIMVHKANGYSLLDIIVTLGIFTMVIGGVISFFSSTLDAKDLVFGRFNLIGDVRRATQNFVAEIRGANYSSLGAYPIAEADPGEIIFYSNLDSDSYREKVRYFFDGSSLKKGVTKPSGNPLAYDPNSEVVTKLVSHVASGRFTYYDSLYDGTGGPLSYPSAGLVKMVGIELILDINEDGSSAVTFSIAEKAQLRNLKNN